MIAGIRGRCWRYDGCHRYGEKECRRKPRTPAEAARRNGLTERKSHDDRFRGWPGTRAQRRNMGCVPIEAIQLALTADLPAVSTRRSRLPRLSSRSQAGCFNTLASTGILRRRFPVAAKIALAMAGTTPEVPVSPMPPGGSELLTT